MKKKRVIVFIPGQDNLFADDTTKFERCKCGAGIYTTKNKAGEIIPVHKAVNGWVPHYDCCPAQIKKYE